MTAFAAAGAELVDANTAFAADLVLKVHSPNEAELLLLKPGAFLAGMLDPFNADNNACLAASGITAFALEAAPRTTRAQSLDVLSSQANIAGYKAVLVASNIYQRFMPMLMTAAGTVKAARVLVLGAGVAGPAGHRYSQAAGRGHRSVGCTSRRERANRIAGREVPRCPLRNR